ncbi:PrsW family intramembrane metalloprotease [Actinomyces faecalis]|uniref:PrsW family intramembrane metalloprotease n=1 Tax=Actinomyces faecalis TaxID=2722820 RepID=UPI001FD54C4E|nr:PrsW family intramembrane metalloprotease [Actinomyces faecalis]
MSQAPLRSQSGSWAGPQALRRRRARDVVAYLVAAVGGVGLMVVLAVVYSQAGEVTAMVWPALLALVPLGIVLVVVRWIDRWEPEPFSILLTAFLWGAGVATAVSLAVNTTTALLASSVTATSGDLVASVVSAPVIEEVTKGAGVLIIFLVWRRSFNGPVDGIVYAAVVAAGFAFAENILYFVQYRDHLATTFLMRAVASPFAHVTFTSCTGLAIGLASRMRSSVAWVWMTPCGLVGAVLLHAFWNGVLAAAPSLYLLVEVPFFLACIGLVVWLRWSERMTMRNRLADYARAGWYEQSEVVMMTTSAGRAAALRWARRRGTRTHAAMKDLLGASASLAALRQQALDGYVEADYGQQERELLDVVRRSKEVLGQG